MMRTTLSDIFTYAKKCGIPQHETEIILSHIARLSLATILAHPEKSIPERMAQKVCTAISKRKNGTPIPYITNTKEFFGIPLFVNASVLIPRPETELLVEWILEHAQKNSAILDLGTGSGAIAIALAQHLPDATITATDVSRAALKVARKNIRATHTNSHIHVRHSNLLQAVPKMHRFDIIVANLPYLSSRFQRHHSTKQEPTLALIAKENGLALYKKLLPQLMVHAKTNTQCIFEADPRNIHALRKHIQKAFPKSRPIIHKDLAKHARFITFEIHKKSDTLTSWKHQPPKKK